MKNLKAVFFDMDGTVIDTEPVHTRAFALAAEAMNIKDDADFLSRCIGLNNTEMKKLYVELIGTAEEFEKCAKIAWKAAEDIKATEGLKVKDGFYELMTELGKIGAKSYIVTSSPRKYALHDLELAGVLHYFADLICFEDYEKGKPAPEPYLKALKLSGFVADNCIAVEDSEPGIRSASTAGLRTVLIRDMAVIPEEAASLAYKDLKSLKDIINL